MLSSDEMLTLKDNIKKYEGKVRHMYLDPKGVVLVGVGHVLAHCEDAQCLPFQHDNGDLANEDEIAKEYEGLKKHEVNHIASYYRQFTQLNLPDHAIDRLMDEHIESFYRELHIIYDDFESFPSGIKLALFDLIFNLGKTELRKDWPVLNACIATGDWSRAAQHCRRHNVSDARNSYVKSLFVSACD